MKVMMVLLYPSAGIISFIKKVTCLCTSPFLKNGRLGISVNKKRKDGGMAMMKLYAMAEARSVSPTVFTWR